MITDPANGGTVPSLMWRAAPSPRWVLGWVLLSNSRATGQGRTRSPRCSVVPRTPPDPRRRSSSTHHRAGRTVKYRLREDALTALGSAVTYRRRTTDQLDRKIIELVNETGTINARMVRILLDLDAVGASRVLADLVDRGILVKTSEATRGPNVTYGRGAAFPAKAGSRSNQRDGRAQREPRSQAQLPLDGLEEQ